MSDTTTGYIGIARSTFESNVWWLERRVFSRWEAWLDLLQRASFAPRNYSTGYGAIPMARGDVICALRPLAESWRWSKSATSVFLKHAEKAGHLSVRSTGQYGTLYAIVKYDTWTIGPAANGTPKRTPKQTPSGHLRDKIEEGEEGKEGEKQKHSPTATWLTPVCDAWESVLGVGTFASLAKQAAAALAPLKRAGTTPEDMGTRLAAYLAATAHEPRFRSITKFAQTFGQWAPTNGASQIPAVDQYGVMNDAMERATRPAAR